MPSYRHHSPSFLCRWLQGLLLLKFKLGKEEARVSSEWSPPLCPAHLGGRPVGSSPVFYILRPVFPNLPSLSHHCKHCSLV